MSESSPEPRPNFEVAPRPQTSEQVPEESLDSGPTGEAAGQRPATAQPTMPPPDPVVLPAAPDSTQQGPTNVVLQKRPVRDSGMTAQDTDLIEKEWVDRTKDVVARTQDDPYIQKKEISKVKADYIQKRFNKTIKTDDSAV